MSKFLFRGLLALPFVILLIGAAATARLWSELPKTEGRLDIPYLAEEVSVTRDANGIPTIEAKSDHDGYVALGFVHAQDRMWSMEQMRRLGAGRLAEVAGERAFPIDRFMRTLGLYRVAEANLAHLDAETKAALEAYALGVNAWISHRTTPLPIEFAVLGFEPEPWKPADSLVWGKLMALQLSGNWRDELLRAKLDGQLTPEQIDDLWAPADGEDVKTAAMTPSSDLPANGIAAMLAAIPDAAQPRLASNIWAVDGSRSDSGKPLLANDPHLGFQAPIMWYLARLRLPGLDLTGATVPGVPFHMIGHNGHAAWGMTTTHSDTMDLFSETLDGDRAVTPNGFQPLQVRREEVRIRGEDERIITIRESRHGPLISDILPPGEAAGLHLALASTALLEDDRTANALYRMNRARQWEAFRDSLRDFHAPQQNIAYADRDGMVALISPAKVPLRGQGDGTRPQPGADGKADWQGWVPFEALPQIAAPASGMVVNANNRPVAETYPYLLAKNWPEPYRARRIEGELAAMGAASAADMAALQLDTVSPMAAEMLPLLLPMVETTSPRIEKALDVLRGWDGEMTRDRPQPLLFQAWLRHLQAQLANDELGELANQFPSTRPYFLRRALQENSPWCDNATSAAVETCSQVVTTAFQQALDEISRRYGADPAGWRWGDAHRARFEHGLFRYVPGMNGITSLEIATDGADFTINRGSFGGSGADAFRHLHGAGLRVVYDLADLGASRFIIATGQSGNMASDHYGDLLQPWRDGKTLTFSADKAAHLVLAPKSGGS